MRFSQPFDSGDAFVFVGLSNAYCATATVSWARSSMWTCGERWSMTVFYFEAKVRNLHCPRCFRRRRCTLPGHALLRNECMLGAGETTLTCALAPVQMSFCIFTHCFLDRSLAHTLWDSG